MPFGLKKGDKDGDLDAKKASLFGGRSKGSSKAPAQAAAGGPAAGNPYANVGPAPGSNPYASGSGSSDPYASRGGQDPYAAGGGKSSDPYARGGGGGPPTSSFGNMSLNSNDRAPPSYSSGGSGSQMPNRYEKSPVPQGGYGGAGASPLQQQQGRYGNSGQDYGQSGGYGSDPYGTGNSGQQSRYGPGGYGGLGRTNSQDTMSTDAGRNALFGDAPQRATAKPSAAGSASQGGYGASSSSAGGGDNSYTNSGGYDSSEMPGGYGSGPPRELTAEEQEEEDVLAAKQEIRFIKQQDVASTRNARRIAEQVEQTGRETLARLGAQGERIHNTERNLDMASNQNRLAEEKARELKTLNRSMFAVHVANPFTAKKREEAANAIALEKHQREREMNDATRAQAYSSTARQQATAREIGAVNGKPLAKASLADRAKYQFEADSEDDEMENEIEDNLYVATCLPLGGDDTLRREALQMC